MTGDRPEPPTLGRLFHAEVNKAARQPLTLLLALILVAYALLLLAAFSVILRAPSEATEGSRLLVDQFAAGAVPFLGGVLGSIATFLVVVFATQNVGREFAQGTLRTLMLAGVARRRFGAAKALLLVVGVAGAFTLLVAVLALIDAATLNTLANQPSSGVDPAATGRLVRHAWILTSAWGLIGLGIVLLVRSPGASLGIVLGTLVGGDVIAQLFARLGDIGVWIGRAMPGAAITGLADGPASPTDWAWIVPSLLVYVGGSLALGFHRLQTIDVLAATKA